MRLACGSHEGPVPEAANMQALSARALSPQPPPPQIARAPRGHHPRVQPVAELQRDQAWVPEGAEEGGIDLSLLTACLCPSDLVRRLAPPAARSHASGTPLACGSRACWGQRKPPAGASTSPPHTAARAHAAARVALTQVEAEGDEVWEPDQLLAALKSELYASEDPAAGGSGGERALPGTP